MLYDYLLCPYCGEKQLNHEPDDISSNMCYTQCEHCDKHFWYSVTVTRTYDSYKDSQPEPESRKCGYCKHWREWEEDRFVPFKRGDCDKIPKGFSCGDYTFDGYAFFDEEYDEDFHCFEPREVQ